MQVDTRKSPEQFHKRFARLLRTFADEVEAELDGMGDPADPWIDQDHSPLGKWKHLELAKTGVLKASKGHRKKVLIKQSEIDRYLAEHPVKVRAEALAYATADTHPEHMKTKDPAELEAAMCRELGLVKKARS